MNIKFPTIRRDAVTLTALLGLVCVLIIGLSAVMYGVYIKRSEAPVLRYAAGWMPVARVGSHIVPYGRFLKSRHTMGIYLRSPLAVSQGLDPVVTPSLEKASLDRLMRELAVSQMATEKKVSVTTAEATTSFDTMVESSSSTIPDPDKYLRETFDWTKEEYVENIVLPAMLEERVAAALSSDKETQLQEMQKTLVERLAKPDVSMYLRFD